MSYPQSANSELSPKVTLMPRTGVVSPRWMTTGTVRQSAQGVISTPVGGSAAIMLGMPLQSGVPVMSPVSQGQKVMSPWTASPVPMLSGLVA